MVNLVLSHNFISCYIGTQFYVNIWCAQFACYSGQVSNFQGQTQTKKKKKHEFNQYFLFLFGKWSSAVSYRLSSSGWWSGEGHQLKIFPIRSCGSSKTAIVFWSPMVHTPVAQQEFFEKTVFQDVEFMAPLTTLRTVLANFWPKYSPTVLSFSSPAPIFLIFTKKSAVPEKAGANYSLPPLPWLRTRESTSLPAKSKVTVCCQRVYGLSSSAIDHCDAKN